MLGILTIPHLDFRLKTFERVFGKQSGLGILEQTAAGGELVVVSTQQEERLGKDEN